MEIEEKRQLNVRRDEMTIGEDGKIIISNPEIAAALKDAAECADSININFLCWLFGN